MVCWYIRWFEKAIFTFFFFIKKKLKFYESFIFFNAYRLAQIYSKYGLVDSYIYFNKMCIKNNIESYNISMEYKYTYLKFFIFCYEFFIFLALGFTFLVLSIGWVDASWVYLISSVYMPPLEIFDIDEGITGLGVVLGRRTLDSQLHAYFHANWNDLWGIF